MIYLSAGHHAKDPGAVGCKGLKEADLTIIQRDLVKLQLDKLGAKYIIDDDKETLGEYLKRIQTGNGSVVLEFHFNAFNGKATGTEVIISDAATQNSKAFAKELADISGMILNIPNRGVKTERDSHRGKLGLMRESGTVALVELCFIDNCSDVEKWSLAKEKLALEYARLLIKYEKLIS